MQARDVMTSPVITVTPDMTVEAVAQLLLDKGISAVPVVGADGALIGIVSEGDLLHRREIGTEPRRRWWLELFKPTTEIAHEYAKSRGLRVRSVMTDRVVSVAPTEDLNEVVDKMERQRVRRVFVTEEGELLGVVTRANILRGLVASREHASTSDLDREIRSRLLQELSGQDWTSILENDVVVTDGVVSYWGAVDSPDEREALRVAAENIPGVKRVEDHTIDRRILPPLSV